MQLGFDVQIPDGLLAANALLAKNSRQGFATGNRVPYQGLNRANCTAALGLSWSVASGTCSTHVMGRFMSPDWSAQEEPVPYAKLDNPQSLNLYGYVLNNPLSKADPDGHDCCDDLLQFAGGVIQGAASSVSFGLVGSPRSSDSSASLAGQLVGTSIIGGTGTSMVSGSGPTALGGLALAPETGGASLVVSAGAAGAAVAGSEMAAGAAKNGVAVSAAMAMKAGGNFSQGQKQAAKDAAGGKCQNCGVETTPGQKSQKGVTPPGTQGEGDHINPKSNGGTNGSDNIQHLCRDCNAAKGNKVPGQQ